MIARSALEVIATSIQEDSWQLKQDIRILAAWLLERDDERIFAEREAERLFKEAAQRLTEGADA